MMKLSSAFQRGVRLLVGTCTLAIILPTCFADRIDDAVQELNQAVEKELEELRKPDGKRRGSSQLPAVVKRPRSLNDNGEFEQQLDSLSRSAQTPEVKEAIKKLRAVTIEERSTQVAELQKKAEAEIAAASETINNAKKASALDGILKNLRLLIEQRTLLFPYGNYPPTGPAAKLDSVQLFVLNWQDYLSNLAGGQPELALTNLDSEATTS